MIHYLKIIPKSIKELDYNIAINQLNQELQTKNSIKIKLDFLNSLLIDINNRLIEVDTDDVIQKDRNFVKKYEEIYKYGAETKAVEIKGQGLVHLNPIPSGDSPILNEVWKYNNLIDYFKFIDVDYSNFLFETKSYIQNYLKPSIEAKKTKMKNEMTNKGTSK